MRALQIVLMLSATPATIVAQSSAASWPVESGSRVRIEAPVFNKPKVATVVAAEGDTLVFRAGKSGTVNPIAVTDITRLDVSRGSHTRRMRGFLVGFAAGALISEAIDAMGFDQSKCLGCAGIGRWADVAVVGVVGGTIGGIAGVLMGSGQTETWEPVALPKR